MRALLVSSLFAASVLTFGGCALNSGPRDDDEGRTEALSSAMLAQSDVVVTLHRAGRAFERGEKIPGINFHYNVETARESGSGQAEGKRQQITITMVGGLVPPILEQLALNENLEGIVFEFIQKTPSGQVTIIRRITLLNASVSELVRTLDSTGDGKLERISFTSETLEVNDR